MFARLGRFDYKFRFAVLAVMITGLLGLGAYGLDIALGKHLSQGGYFDDSSQSAEGSRLMDDTYGRDHDSDVIVLYTAPAGKTIDDPAFVKKVTDSLNGLPKKYPDEIGRVNKAYWPTETGERIALMGRDNKYAFASVSIVGDDDTTQTNNYQKVKGVFEIPGIDVQVAGRQAVAGTLNNTMGEDIHRMEILAVPAVAVLLFLIFGGIVAASLPLIIGGLTICGGWGIVRIITNFTEVNGFVSPVVSMIGLGLAIDYGLFIVSRFREELAEGYEPSVAVRRTVVTAGRTVAMSVTIIVASVGGLLLFPQGFLKSLAYGAAASVSIAGLTAVTILPAMLGVLGHRVDALGLKWIRKTKTSEEIESSIWSRLTRAVMRHPLKVAIPIVIGLSLLIIPVKSIAFGGLSEKLLPPDDPTRLAQQHFDQLFPSLRTDPLVMVIQTDQSRLTGNIKKEASQAPGITSTGFVQSTDKPAKNGVWVFTAQPKNNNDIKPTIDYLRSMEVPDGATVMIAGTPALQQDSVDALIGRLPLMIAIGMVVSTLLMFLTFGSLVLPIKAALMSALGLGSTLGILTLVFVDGHGSVLLNFTPGPIMAPVLVLIIALVYGLSVDYEVFLLSRMVEARALGASTSEAVRVGMSHTSRIITAAALILIVVTGAFGFSHLVMMQYIAYGMIAALVIDATLLRMFLVPATMKLLGDDCWWAPAWMKRVQEKSGFGEPILADERLPKDLPVLASAKPKTNRPEDALTMEIPMLEPGPRAQSAKSQQMGSVKSLGPKGPDGGRSEHPKRPDGPRPPEGQRLPEGQRAPEGQRPPEGQRLAEGQRPPEGQRPKDGQRPAEGQRQEGQRPPEGHRPGELHRPAELNRMPAEHRPPPAPRAMPPGDRPRQLGDRPRPPAGPPPQQRPPAGGPRQQPPPADRPGPPADRRSIEDWLADLRSPAAPQEPPARPEPPARQDPQPRQEPPARPDPAGRQEPPGRPGPGGRPEPPVPGDGGRHHRGNDSVSVNELLRRGREDRD